MADNFQIQSVDPYDSQKDAAGNSSTWTWIGASIYFIYTSSESVNFIKGGAFIFIGMFISAVVMGWVLYLAQRGVAKLFVITNMKNVNTIVIIGVLIKLIHFALVVYFTYFCFNLIF